MAAIAPWATVGSFIIAAVALFLNLRDRGMIPEWSVKAILRYLTAIALLMGFLFAAAIGSIWLASLWRGPAFDLIVRATIASSILSMLLGLLWWNKIAPGLVATLSSEERGDVDPEAEQNGEISPGT